MDGGLPDEASGWQWGRGPAAACEGQHGQRAGLGATRRLGIVRLARQAPAGADCPRVRKRSRRTMEAIQKRLTKATGVIQ
jgi:hypothetical protein